jgi:ribosomal protein S18 acetylase RimI-like enzyme
VSETVASEAVTVADVEAAARILIRCFDGQENAKLGMRYARALIRSFALDRSRSLHLARRDGRIAGFAAGEPSVERSARYRSLRPAAAAAILLRPWVLLDPAIVRMALSRLRTAEPRAIDSWFLTIVAVDPLFQRQGIGRDLLERFEDDARRRGYRLATLEVQAWNARARAMYDARGWRRSAGSGPGRLLYELSLAPPVNS